MLLMFLLNEKEDRGRRGGRRKKIARGYFNMRNEERKKSNRKLIL
jgi:hypothetical protein